jgi:hypothetical protein
VRGKEWVWEDQMKGEVIGLKEFGTDHRCLMRIFITVPFILLVKSSFFSDILRKERDW